EKNLLKNNKYVEIELQEGLGFLRIVKGVLANKELSIAKQVNTSPDSISLDSSVFSAEREG
ncbi:MAG: hypothetical protein ACW98I_10970, partial [Candidatus Hodarchaeales archaeon]